MNYGERLVRSDTKRSLRKREWSQLSFTETALSSRNASSHRAPASTATRRVIQMGNKATTGPFAPIVVVTRNVVGKKKFNTFRGKAIALHSQVIRNFCDLVGAEKKQAQGVIRLAKKNGERLGFLA